MAGRLQELAADHSNILMSIHHTNILRSEIQGVDYHQTGYITKEYLNDTIPLLNTHYYLCGPSSFMQAMYGHLIALGVLATSIHYEFFGDARPLGKPFPSNKTTANKWQVVFKRSGKSALWTGTHQSILELAESVGLSPDYSCRMGTCATCETPIEDGVVDYNPEPFLEAQEGNVFICCSKPSTDITLDM
jgi:ferredoxin